MTGINEISNEAKDAAARVIFYWSREPQSQLDWDKVSFKEKALSMNCLDAVIIALRRHGCLVAQENRQ